MPCFTVCRPSGLRRRSGVASLSAAITASLTRSRFRSLSISDFTPPGARVRVTVALTSSLACVPLALAMNSPRSTLASG